MLAADADGDDDRDQQGDEAEDARDAGLEEDGHGDRLDAFLVAVAGFPAHPLEVAEDLAGGGVPAFGVDGAGGRRGAAVDDAVLEGGQFAGGCGAPVVGEDGAVVARQYGQAGRVQDAALGDAVGEAAQVAFGHGAGDDRRGHQRVLAGDGLAGAGDVDQGAALLVHLDVLQRVQRREELVVRVDEVVVRLEGRVAGDGVVLDLGAQRGQPAEALEDVVHAFAGDAVEVVAHGGVGGVVAQLVDDLVRLAGAVAQLAQRVGAAPVGQEEQALPPFLLERLDSVLGGVAEFGDDIADAEQLVGLASGEVRGERPHGREGHQWHQQQRCDLPSDRLPSKAHGLPYVVPGARGGCSVNKRREPTTDEGRGRSPVRTLDPQVRGGSSAVVG